MAKGEGERLRDRRNRLRCSQKSLSAKSGVSQQTISRVESGTYTRGPNDTTIQALNDALDEIESHMKKPSHDGDLPTNDRKGTVQIAQVRHTDRRHAGLGAGRSAVPAEDMTVEELHEDRDRALRRLGEEVLRNDRLQEELEDAKRQLQIARSQHKHDRTDGGEQGGSAAGGGSGGQ